MASDNLNQVGKYIRDSGDKAQRAVKKQKPVRPSIERTRDIFDVDIPFHMEFDVAPNQKSVSLDLEFNKPPPTSGCLTGSGIAAHCESFTLGSGDHELQLSYAIRTSPVSVFVNGSTWSTFKWYVSDYGIEGTSVATVMVTQLPLTTNTVSICYIEAATIETVSMITFLDNFDDRTLSGSFGWIVIGPASGCLDYTNSNQAYVYYGTLSIGSGIMRYTGPPDGYSSSGPMTAYLNGAWEPLSEVTQMQNFGYRFRTSYIPTKDGGLLGPWETHIYLDTWNGDSIGFDLNVCSTSGYGSVGVYSSMPVAVDAAEPKSIGKTDWVANTWYTVKGVIDGHDLRVKVWADEIEAEPSTYLAAGQADDSGGDWDLSVYGPYISYYLNFECDTTTYGSDHTFDWDGVWVERV